VTNRLHRILRQPLAWVFIAAFAIRLYACLATTVVNPDGLIYIQQARAIYFHQWRAITDCGMQYLSILPPMIAAAFALFKDWVVAGRVISLAFGWGTLIPLYFLLKRFFDHRTVTLTLLVYAFIPALVGRSADIIRGPVFWFFLACAYLMVIRSRDNRTSTPVDLDLVLAGLFFLLAAWARIEALLYLFVTAGFLLLATDSSHRIRGLLGLLTPLGALALLGVITAAILNLPLTQLLRLDKPFTELATFIGDYRTIRTSVDVLAETQQGHVNEFLKSAGDFIWIVPLGPMLDCLAEKFFYPYVLIFLAGFVGFRRRIKEDPRAVYFFWLCVSAVVLLYLYTLKTWMIFDRFLINLILPAVLFVGYGCSNLLRILQEKWHFSARGAGILLAVVILAFGLGKNLRPRYAEKEIFPQMAEMILDRKIPGEPVRIAAGRSTAYEWVSFYANRDVAGAVCDKALLAKIPKTYDRFVSKLEGSNIRFVLWSEKTWPKDGFDLMTAPYKDHFEVIGQWDYAGKEEYLLMVTKRP
jgi:hypothetical protein